MFQPPETFQQLRALSWAAPCMAGMGMLGALWALGLPSLAPWAALLAALLAWALAMAAVWVSHYGVLHSLVTGGMVFATVCLPGSVLLVPAVAPVNAHGWGPVLAVAGCQVLLLVSATVWHARRAIAPPGTKRLHWLGCLVDREHASLSKADAPPEGGGAAVWVAPGLIGAASVGAYQLLKAALPADALVIVGLVVANALSSWLTVGPVGRAWGQSVRLRQLERIDGERFVSSRLPWLRQERLRSPIGRWAQGRISPRT